MMNKLLRSPLFLLVLLFLFPVPSDLSRRVRSNKIMAKSPEERILLDWKLEIHLALDGSK